MKLSIAHLRAAGISDKLILDAIAEVEVEEREKNRIRQRNHRARNASHSDTRDGRDGRDTNIEERKKEEGSKFSTRSARTKKIMTPLPENWHPELAGQIEFEKFSDHARQNDRHCADWEAAWRNWNRNKSKFDPKGGNGNGADRRADKKAHSISATFDDIFDRIERGDEPSVVSFKTHPRLLPDR